MSKNVVIAAAVVLFVSLAMAQMIIFDLSAETKTNLILHKGIAFSGIGAAFYARFLSGHHFSGLGRLGLKVTVIGIVFVGSVLNKRKKKRVAQTDDPASTALRVASTDKTRANEESLIGSTNGERDAVTDNRQR